MILFITRKFPPSRGGMEKVAYELSRHLAGITKVKLVKWGGSNKWLPFVLPYLFLRSVWVLLTQKVSAVYIEDGLLAPLGLALKVFRKPVAVTIHGRDIAYKNRFYQWLVPRCIDRLDRVICNSVAIKNECIKKGIRETKTAVIPNGMSDEFYSGQGKDIFRQKLSQITGLNLNGRSILLSAGRLIEKKGIHWFVEAVMPCLVSADCIYVIAGDGILYDKIKNSINSLKLENHVYMLGWADSDMLKVLYNAADIFIMPDIPVEGDMEGFGLVAIEAAACSLPVVAANLDGIREAVADGQNGFMVEPGDIQGFTNKVRELLGDDKLRQNFGAQARRYTLENYGWESRAQRYLEEFAGMANN